MTLYGEAIIERLPFTSGLKNPNNLFNKLIDNGVGGFLDNYSENDLLENIFLNSATGKYLDLWGSQFNVTRQKDETDAHYRERIILMSLGHLTILYLLDVYDLQVYYSRDDFDIEENTLTSDNPYLANNKLMISCTEEIKEVLEKKFVVGSEITWLIQ